MKCIWRGQEVCPDRWYFQKYLFKGKICFHFPVLKEHEIELFGQLTLDSCYQLASPGEETVNVASKRDIPPRRCFKRNTPWNCVINSTTEGATEFVYCQSEDWVTSVSLILSWLKSSFFLVESEEQSEQSSFTGFRTTLASSNEYMNRLNRLKNCRCFFHFWTADCTAQIAVVDEVCTTRDPQTSSTRFVLDLQKSGKDIISSILALSPDFAHSKSGPPSPCVKRGR